LNGYPKGMIKNKKKRQHNRSPEFRSKVILPCTANLLGETLKRILERHCIRNIFKPAVKLSTVLSSSKDTVPASKRRGGVYEIPCGTAHTNALEKRNEAWVLDFFFFWASCWNHCLAALDLGAGVEQPFNYLIVQHRQAIQSMGRSKDWTLEDNMVDDLFFCATQAAEEAILHLYKHERKRSLPVRRRLSRTQALLERIIPGGGCQCRGWKCRVLWGCPSTIRIPLVIRPLRRTYIVVVRKTDEMLCGRYNCVSRF